MSVGITYTDETRTKIREIMTNLQKPTQSEIAELFNSKKTFPIDFEPAWEWLGYSGREYAKGFFLSYGFIEDKDYTMDEHNIISMSCECLKLWCMLSGTENGRRIRFMLFECESTLRQQYSEVNFFSLEKAAKLKIELESFRDKNPMVFTALINTVTK